MLEMKRTGDPNYSRWMKVLVLGHPRSGKTTFVSTFPNLVIGATLDAGLMSIAHKNLPYVELHSKHDLDNLLLVLRDVRMRQKVADQMGLPAVETIAIDTFDGVQQLLVKERLAAEKRSQMQRDDWGWLLEQQREILQSFVALPLHVVVTCHVKTSQDDQGRIISAPALQGSFQDEIPGYCDFSVLAQRRREIDKNGRPKIVYSLQVEGDEGDPHIGNRSAGRLRDTVEPDFKVLFNAVYQNLHLEKHEPVRIDASTPPPPSDDDEPVTPEVLIKLDGLYNEVDLPRPQQAEEWTLGQARQVARAIGHWRRDHALGNANRDALRDALQALGAYQEPEVAQEEGQPLASMTVEQAVQQTVQGAIDWVEARAEGRDERARALLALEQEFRDPPRSTLIAELKRRGYIPDEPVDPVETDEQPDEAPVESSSEAVDQQPAEPQSDGAPTPEQVEETLREGLDAELLRCAECGQEVDDRDIAQLSEVRFRRILCVKHYMEEGRKMKEKS